MKSIIKKVLKEELTSSDKKEVRDIFKSELKKTLSSTELKKQVEDVIIKQLGSNKKTRKEVASITQKVLVRLYKTFWTRKNFWSNNLDKI